MNKLVLAMGLICTAAALADEPAKAEKKERPFYAVAAGEMKFVHPPDAPAGVQVAPLTGNPTKGASSSITKIAAGEKHPLHTHTANIKQVVISGTWIVGADEKSAKEYGPGSYVYTPGGWPHYSACKEGAECVFFQENSAPMDIKPAEGAAPAPAPAAK